MDILHNHALLPTRLPLNLRVPISRFFEVRLVLAWLQLGLILEDGPYERFDHLHLLLFFYILFVGKFIREVVLRDSKISHISEGHPFTLWF